ncbi:MAG: ABC transporter permease [Lachnospiraceae bacterium]|nr:ABC transporter permease [Lachnospiraceae bacterium]
MFKRKSLSLPYILFILCGTVIPLLAILYYAMVDKSGHFTLANLAAIGDPLHLKPLLFSLLLAFICTAICLLLAFPLGLMLRRSGAGKKGFVIFLLILPMWMNFLLRTIAWKILLQKTGVINAILNAVGLKSLEIINTPYAVVLGMVYDFLPFMILPIYNVMIKIDNSLVEAAYDLGASPFRVMKDVLLPLSMPGIISGVTMTFVPSMTSFAISEILGGGNISLIGNIIEGEFLRGGSRNVGSGISMVMMVFILISMALLNKVDKNGEGAVV